MIAKTSQNEGQNLSKFLLADLLGHSWGLLGASWAQDTSPHPEDKGLKGTVGSNLGVTWEPKSTKNRRKSMLKKHLF